MKQQSLKWGLEFFLGGGEEGRCVSIILSLWGTSLLPGLGTKCTSGVLEGANSFL